MAWGYKRKTNAKRTEYDGVMYDSKLEACYAEFLDALKAENKIKSWERQVKYPLADMYGELKLSYKADFLVQDLSGFNHVVEIKGRLLPADKVKYGYVKYVHNVDINLVNCRYNNKDKTYYFKEEVEHCPWLQK